MVTTNTPERIEFRTTEENKLLIEHAAALHGVTVTEFAVTHLVKAAREVVQEDTVTRLSNRDRDIFLAMLAADEEPNPALKQAFRDLR